ncbi:hypothetical protein A3F66_01545 [candidate division TM6 bacterium RIFCSPHIGHO2_12_FULL_32_22]|nr:MAG: hypothetical protein A3F66_01545 [candidate division TM6 bacterium RIFCSPHIGHO2_12_FULL_32_22]
MKKILVCIIVLSFADAVADCSALLSISGSDYAVNSLEKSFDYFKGNDLVTARIELQNAINWCKGDSTEGGQAVQQYYCPNLSPNCSWVEGCIHDLASCSGISGLECAAQFTQNGCLGCMQNQSSDIFKYCWNVSNNNDTINISVPHTNVCQIAIKNLFYSTIFPKFQGQVPQRINISADTVYSALGKTPSTNTKVFPDGNKSGWIFQDNYLNAIDIYWGLGEVDNYNRGTDWGCWSSGCVSTRTPITVTLENPTFGISFPGGCLSPQVSIKLPIGLLLYFSTLQFPGGSRPAALQAPGGWGIGGVFKITSKFLATIKFDVGLDFANQVVKVGSSTVDIETTEPLNEEIIGGYWTQATALYNQYIKPNLPFGLLADQAKSAVSTNVQNAMKNITNKSYQINF